jgi:hypothetical protein
VKRALAAVLLAPAAVLAAQFSVVRPTNFSGYDEWLYVSLASRGIVGVPYANRPLVFLWTVPGAFVLRDDLLGYFLAHASYLALAGVFTAWIAARLLPGAPLAALVAGVTATAWAPLDYMRLDTVVLTSYAGFTAAALGALVLFLEGWLQSRPLLALAGGALAALTVLGFEGTLPVLAAAPLLAWLLPGREPGAGRRWLRWAALWELGLLAAVAPLLAALATPGAPSYQTSALGLDLHPLRVLLRMLRQLRDHVAPLVSSAPPELREPVVALAVAVFAAAALLVWRVGKAAPPAEEPGRPALLRVAALGALLAGLGWVALSLSPAVRSPARAQVLSAPGVALLLAGAVAGAATLIPARARRAALVLFGAWVVAVGTGRTAAMQREWDAATYWPVQRDVLVQLTAAAPGLAPNTLVVLLDEAGAFPATFTFHHAVRTVYGEGVRGHVWAGEDFLYPARFDEGGVSVEPWPVIRGPWRSPSTRHRYDEVVVARMGSDRRLTVLDEWPAALPPLPPGAAYAPRARVRSGDPPPGRHILARVR